MVKYRYILNVCEEMRVVLRMTAVHGFISMDMCKIFRYGIFLSHSINSFHKCSTVGIRLLHQFNTVNVTQTG